MSNLPDNLPDLLRKHGLKVKEVNGWRGRGRPASTGTFSPVGVLCHHTATKKTSSDDAVISLLVNGRPDLPGPLCQLGLGRDGVVHVVASGRANHGGDAQASGTVSQGDGNSLYIGIEAFNDGVGEKWLSEQYDAYVLLAAALCVEITGNSAKTVRAHKETSVTGKIDPTFAMDPFRDKVAAKIQQLNTKPSKPVKGSRGGRVDHAIKDLRAASTKGGRGAKIKAALSSLLKIKPNSK